MRYLKIAALLGVFLFAVGSAHAQVRVGIGVGPVYGSIGSAPACDYGYYGYSKPYAATQYWYYCSNPAGYYPYVTQCNTGWQTVPAS